MSSSYGLICLFALVFVANVYGEDSVDECHPKPPAPGKHKEICCKLPDLMKKKEDDQMHKAFHDCIGILKETHPEILPEKFQGPPPSEDSEHPHPPHPSHPHGPPPVKFLECVQECIYNNSGLMTPEMKPSPEAIQKIAQEFIGDEEKWNPIASEAIKKCTEKAPTVGDDAVCKSGAHQTTLCMMREMYMHCPEESWNDSEECKAEKALIEKCPNMPPPFRMRAHGVHHKKD